MQSSSSKEERDPTSSRAWSRDTSSTSFASLGKNKDDEAQVIGKLRDIWSTVLEEDTSDIGYDDVFFDLGGNSLTASELVDLANEQEICLALEDIFQNPTLHGMVLAALQNSSSSSKPSPTNAHYLASLDLTRSRSINNKTLGDLRREVSSKSRLDADDFEDIYPCSPLQSAMMVTSLNGHDSYMTQLVYTIRRDVEVDRLATTWNADSTA